MNIEDLVEAARGYGTLGSMPLDMAEKLLEYGIAELLQHCQYYECLNLLERAETSVRRAKLQAVTFLD
jgi:hypothetical protein